MKLWDPEKGQGILLALKRPALPVSSVVLSPRAVRRSVPMALCASRLISQRYAPHSRWSFRVPGTPWQKTANLSYQGSRHLSGRGRGRPLLAAPRIDPGVEA